MWFITIIDSYNTTIIKSKLSSYIASELQFIFALRQYSYSYGHNVNTPDSSIAIADSSIAIAIGWKM